MARTIIGTFSMPPLVREDFVAEQKSIGIPADSARVHDAFQTVLPGTAASDDAAVTGTNAVAITSGNVSNTSVTRYWRFLVAVPMEYVAATNLVIQVVGKIFDGNAAVVSATVDFECYRHDGSGASGSDLVSTAATSINFTTDTILNFTVDGTTVLPGDVLNIRGALIVNDTGGGDACTLRIGRVSLLCNVLA